MTKNYDRQEVNPELRNKGDHQHGGRLNHPGDSLDDQNDRFALRSPYRTQNLPNHPEIIPGYLKDKRDRGLLKIYLYSVRLYVIREHIRGFSYH